MTWGQSWGTFFWGGDAALAGDFVRGYEVNAKPDTYYLGKSNGQAAASNFTDFATDRSQFANANWGTGSGHPRLTDANTNFDIAYPREITLIIDCDNTDTGVLFMADDATNSFGLTLASSGVLTPTVDNASDTNGQITLPGISGSDQRYVISWVSDRSRDSGEAEVRSWIFVYNTTADTFSQVTWLHIAEDPVISGAGLNLWGNAGASIFTGTAVLARLGNRFHTATELYEDFIQQSDIPSLTGETRVEPPVPDRASGIGDVAEMVGPVESTVAAAIHKADLRLAGPLVNEAYTDPITTYDRTYLPANWNRSMPVTTTYTLMPQWLVWVPLPRSANKWKARVNITYNGTAGTLGVRVVNFNKIPTITLDQFALNPNPEPNYEQRYVSDSVTPTTSVTAWLTFSDQIREFMKDNNGGTYFCLAFLASDASITFGINAWTIDPIFDKTTNNILGPLSLEP